MSETGSVTAEWIRDAGFVDDVASQTVWTVIDRDPSWPRVLVSGGPRGAALSECGTYRFALWRDIPLPDAAQEPRVATLDSVLFLLANPSTADARFDDPTIHRCMGYARRWKYSTLFVVNVNPYRSSDPSHVVTPPDPILSANEAWIWGLTARSALVVAGYGVSPRPELVHRALEIIRSQRDVYAIDYTREGIPRHPLYLRAELVPMLYLSRAET